MATTSTKPKTLRNRFSHNCSGPVSWNGPTHVRESSVRICWAHCSIFFVPDERDQASALKRGGGQNVISLDSLDAEARYRLEPAQDLTPEKMFEKQWALSVLECVLSRLQAEMADDGKQAVFEALKATLTGVQADSYAAIAVQLGMTEGAIKSAVHRLRRSYRNLLHHEIAQTVASPAEIDDEIRYLLSCLQS